MPPKADEDAAGVDSVLAELEELVQRFRYQDQTERMSTARGGSPLLEKARSVYRARRAREALFGDQPDLFADPVWDILLDLFAAQEAGQRVSISSACIAANVPPTTALRWLAILESRGLIVRISDETDRRRAFVRLSELAHRRMSQWLRTWS